MQWGFLVASIIGLFFFVLRGDFTISGRLILVCVVWSITFTLSYLATVELVRMSYLHSVIPFVTSMSIVGSLIVGVLIFDDSFSLLQIFGIILIIGNIFVWRQGLDITKVRKALFLVSFAILLPVINQFIRKIGVNSFNIESLQFLQYFFGLIFLSIIVHVRKIHVLKEKKKYIYSYGSIMGLASFFGSLFLFIALKNGPYGIVSLVSLMSFIFVSLIGVFFFKEKFTRIHFISLCLVLIGVVLIKIGGAV